MLIGASSATAAAAGAGLVNITLRGRCELLLAAVVALAFVVPTLDTTRAVETPTRRTAATTMDTMIPVCRESRLRC
jgi:hypothetical protein